MVRKHKLIKGKCRNAFLLFVWQKRGGDANINSDNNEKPTCDSNGEPYHK